MRLRRFGVIVVFSSNLHIRAVVSVLCVGLNSLQVLLLFNFSRISSVIVLCE